MYNTIVQITVY